MRRFFSFLLLIFFISNTLSFPAAVLAAKTTFREWKNISVQLGNDVEIVLDDNDFPAGSNFEGKPIKFYLGKKKSRDAGRGNFFAFAGLQGFWDIQPFHENTWRNDYKQELSSEEVLNRHFEMFKDAGVMWVRMDWSWNRIYKGELGQCADNSKYVFDDPDFVFRLAKKHGLKLLADVMMTPKKISICENCTWEEGFQYYPPKDLYQNDCVGDTCSGLRDLGSPCFNEFMKRMVKRYRAGGDYYIDYPEDDESYGITHWEIWNEPDIGFWNPPRGEEERYKSYLYLLRGVYQTIDQVRNETGADLKVLFSGLAYPEINLLKYFDEFGQTLNNYYDIMSMHRYDDVHSSASNLLPSVVSQTRTILDNNGASGKSIWITEAGGKYEPYQTSYLSGVLTDLYNLRNQYKLEKIFWWSSKDYYTDFESYIAGTNGEWNANSGLIKNFYRPKDSYLELAKMIQIAEWRTYDRALNADNSIVFTIPASHLENNQEYILFYSVLNKISTGKTIKISVSDQPPPTYLTGDINQDGKVNILDLRELIGVFATDDQPADLNEDGKVNVFDYVILLSNYGRQ